jgi:hypothetical protein
MGTQIQFAVWRECPPGRLKVFFNGYPGAITAATPTQINVFVPNWLFPGHATVVVQLEAATSAPVEIPVAKAAPGLFASAVHRQHPHPVRHRRGSTNPQLVWGDFDISTPLLCPHRTSLRQPPTPKSSTWKRLLATSRPSSVGCRVIIV